MKKMVELEKISILDITPAQYNPRVMSSTEYEKLSNSINEFGVVDPIIINLQNNKIIGGHQRYDVLLNEYTSNESYNELNLLRLGDIGWVFPSTDLEIKDSQHEKALNIALNKISGEWDNTKLEVLLTDLNLDGFDVDLTGFDNLDISEYGLDITFDDKLISDTGFDEDETETETSFEKDDSIKYFSDEEIINEIIDDWVVYDNLEDFIKNMIDIPSAKYQFNRLCQGYNKEGYNISLLFNPHRLTTPTYKSKDIFYGFNNDLKYRKQFAKYLVNVANKVPQSRLYNKHIGYGHRGYFHVQEFPPYLARDIYKIYCDDGSRILNPCAGWGGRLIGLASCMFEDIEYWETDPSTLTYNGLLKLKEFLRLGDNYKQFNKPFELLDVPKDYFDFVFTSPPYFDTERYSDEDTQSYVNNKSYEDWRDSFLFVMLDKIMYTLKDGGVCVLNVGKNRFPMDSDIIDYLSSKYGVHASFVDEFKSKLDSMNDGSRKDDDAFLRQRHNGGEIFIEFSK